MLDQYKNIIVFGLGISGFSAVQALHRYKANPFCISKGKPQTWPQYQEIRNLLPEASLVDEAEAEDYFKKADLVILSPGIPKNHVMLKNCSAVIWSEIELTYRLLEVRPKIIGITGTFGKTTTVQILGEMLKKANLKVFVGGNIGHAFSQILLDDRKYDVIVLELSSFQLESIDQFRADIGVITNLFFHHQERYENLNQYAQAKWQLFKRMTPKEMIIVNENDELSRQYLAKSPVETLSKMDIIKCQEEFDLKKWKLFGEHNLENLALAIKIFKKLTKDMSAVQSIINEFRGVEHRLEVVAIHELTIINDSKSTAPQATLHALNSVKDPIYLIMGGQKRSQIDFNENVWPQISQKSQKIFLLGEAKDDLKEYFKTKVDTMVFASFTEIKEFIKKYQLKGTLLFSPGFPSYDQYKNFEERGKEFKKVFSSSV